MCFVGPFDKYWKLEERNYKPFMGDKDWSEFSRVILKTNERFCGNPEIPEPPLLGRNPEQTGEREMP